MRHAAAVLAFLLLAPAPAWAAVEIERGLMTEGQAAGLRRAIAALAPTPVDVLVARRVPGGVEARAIARHRTARLGRTGIAIAVAVDAHQVSAHVGQGLTDAGLDRPAIVGAIGTAFKPHARAGRYDLAAAALATTLARSAAPVPPRPTAPPPTPMPRASTPEERRTESWVLAVVLAVLLGAGAAVVAGLRWIARKVLPNDLKRVLAAQAAFRRQAPQAPVLLAAELATAVAGFEARYAARRPADAPGLAREALRLRAAHVAAAEAIRTGGSAPEAVAAAHRRADAVHDRRAVNRDALAIGFLARAEQELLKAPVDGGRFDALVEAADRRLGAARQVTPHHHHHHHEHHHHHHHEHHDHHHERHAPGLLGAMVESLVHRPAPDAAPEPPPPAAPPRQAAPATSPPPPPRSNDGSSGTDSW